VFTLTGLAQAEELSYPNGAKKAVIFSYDDGVIQDRKLVELFNKYNVVGTFNLNAGLFGKKLPWMKNFIGKDGDYITLDEVKTLYQGHEIAGHSYSHPGFAGLAPKKLTRQLTLEQNILSSIRGEKVKSFAYPLGSYDEQAMETIKSLGYTNARTVKDTNTFELPTNVMAWHPTAHHTKAMPLIEEYLQLTPRHLTVMVIWGHSWEFDKNEPDNNWHYAQALLKKISNQDDIWYVSAGDFFDYLQQAKLTSK